MSAVITVNDLCLWYGKTQALKNIDMQIPEKSITALIGPSGCGKSTFLKTLNRMNDLIPEVRITGEVLYQERNIFEPGRRHRSARRALLPRNRRQGGDGSDERVMINGRKTVEKRSITSEQLLKTSMTQLLRIRKKGSYRRISRTAKKSFHELFPLRRSRNGERMWTIPRCRNVDNSFRQLWTTPSTH